MTARFAAGALAAGWLAAAPAAGQIRFTEVTRAAGIRFVNMYGGVASKDYILETTGTGAAWLDYDEDGDLDLFLANGSRLGYDDSLSLSSAMFRNDGDGGFTEVTGPAGLESYGWGQGVAVVDHGDDGDLDLLVTRTCSSRTGATAPSRSAPRLSASTTRSGARAPRSAISIAMERAISSS